MTDEPKNTHTQLVGAYTRTQQLENLAIKAVSSAADVDAFVGTFLTKEFWQQSADIVRCAELLRSMTLHLRLRIEEQSQ